MFEVFSIVERTKNKNLNLDLDLNLNLLNQKGLNVALLSRTESKLVAAASEIELKYKVQTKVVAVDFGAANAADYSRIAGVVGELDVAVLVNNVGMSYDHAEYYDAISDELVDDLIAINIQATNKVRWGVGVFSFLLSLLLSPLLTLDNDDLFFETILFLFSFR